MMVGRIPLNYKKTLKFSTVQVKLIFAQLLEELDL